ACKPGRTRTWSRAALTRINCSARSRSSCSGPHRRQQPAPGSGQNQAQSPLGRLIRVLVVDDSASIRELLSRLLRADGQFEVVGTARDGEEAVARAARLHPDVITMDLHLAKLDGVLATRQIMSETPTPIVVVSSSATSRDVGLAFDALQAGAVTVLEKPPGP